MASPVRRRSLSRAAPTTGTLVKPRRSPASASVSSPSRLRFGVLEDRGHLLDLDLRDVALGGHLTPAARRGHDLAEYTDAVLIVQPVEGATDPSVPTLAVVPAFVDSRRQVLRPADGSG